MKTSSRRFSLIELLIVVAIIVILLSLLQPALRKMINQSNAIVCLNNLKQIGLAMSVYLSDYNDSFPNKVIGGQHWTTNWLGKAGSTHTLDAEQRPLNSYINHNYDILTCPTDFGEAMILDRGSSYSSNSGHNNGSVGYDSRALTTVSVHRLSEIQEPSRMVLFWELPCYWITYRQWFDLEMYMHYEEPRYSMNFVDGSVGFHDVFLGVDSDFEWTSDNTK